MSNFLCKTLILVRNRIPNPPFPKLQSLHFNYSTTISDSPSFTVSYLINSCSFSPKSASSLSNQVCFHSPEKPDSVISFFKHRSFSDSQISYIIQKCPRILLSDPNKTLLPKLEFLIAMGASSSEVSMIIAKHPKILKRSVHKHLVPTFDFLKGCLESNERTISSIKRDPSIIADRRLNHLRSCVEMMLDAGVSKENVAYLFHYHPKKLTISLDRFRETIEHLKKMGFDPLKLSFVQAFRAIRGMSESTWERKLGVYKKWGLSEEEILAAFRRFPNCMEASEEKIMLVMNFFVNKLGWETAAIVRHPVLFSLSLEKRIIPRALVLMFLFQNGLVDKKIVSIKPYICVENLFLQKFVQPHLEEAPQLLELYRVDVDAEINPS